MPIPLFEQTDILNKSEVKPPVKPKNSAMTVFLSVIFVILLIFTLEMAVKDLNRLFNAEYNDCYQRRNIVTLMKPLKVKAECNIEKYRGIRLLLHADLVLPILIISSLGLYVIRKKQLTPPWKALRVAYMFFLLWLALRMIGETEYFLLKHHAIIGKYIIIFTILTGIVYAAVWVQKKIQQKAQL